jgi:ParB family chromosome partitioning protein
VVARRSGLGRGLGALIPSEVASAETGPLNFTELPVSTISTNPNQPRKGFDEEALASLTASVRELGILQPVLVRPLGDDRYELIAGERRWRAAQIAGLPQVPVIIRDDLGSTSSMPEKSTRLEVALIENIQRADLNSMEQAEAYTRLLTEFGLKQQEIADKVGKSQRPHGVIHT